MRDFLRLRLTESMLLFGLGQSVTYGLKAALDIEFYILSSMNIFSMAVLFPGECTLLHVYKQQQLFHVIAILIIEVSSCTAAIMYCVVYLLTPTALSAFILQLWVLQLPSKLLKPGSIGYAVNIALTSKAYAIAVPVVYCALVITGSILGSIRSTSPHISITVCACYIPIQYMCYNI
jgi:hypothetical protein